MGRAKGSGDARQETREAWWPKAYIPGRGSIWQGCRGSVIALDPIPSVQAAGSLPSTLCSSCRENRGDGVKGLQAFSSGGVLWVPSSGLG